MAARHASADGMDNGADAVAESTGRGEELAINRAQIIRLLQDDRLRLPPL